MYFEIQRTIKAFVISKCPPCSDCCILSFGWFPGAWILCGDVSEDSVSPIFIGDVSSLPAYTAYRDGTDRVFRNVHKILTPGNHPKEGIQLSHQFKHLKRS